MTYICVDCDAFEIEDQSTKINAIEMAGQARKSMSTDVYKQTEFDFFVFATDNDQCIKSKKTRC